MGGRGGHAWLLFETAWLLGKARKLHSRIIRLDACRCLVMLQFLFTQVEGRAASAWAFSRLQRQLQEAIGTATAPLRVPSR